METQAKALRIIIFTADNQQPKTLLTDSLTYNPGYRIGDVIHLVKPTKPILDTVDRQYVVLQVKHLIITGEAATGVNEPILLVEVAELTGPDRTEFSIPVQLSPN